MLELCEAHWFGTCVGYVVVIMGRVLVVMELHTVGAASRAVVMDSVEGWCVHVTLGIMVQYARLDFPLYNLPILHYFFFPSNHVDISTFQAQLDYITAMTCCTVSFALKRNVLYPTGFSLLAFVYCR